MLIQYSTTRSVPKKLAKHKMVSFGVAEGGWHGEARGAQGSRSTRLAGEGEAVYARVAGGTACPYLRRSGAREGNNNKPKHKRGVAS